jgi:hypothetical protein
LFENSRIGAGSIYLLVFIARNLGSIGNDWSSERTVPDHITLPGWRIINAVTIQPDQMDNGAFGDSWPEPGPVAELGDLLRGYPESMLGLARQAEDIKPWREANRHCPTTFLRSRVVLIGNAAHPIKPYIQPLRLP